MRLLILHDSPSFGGHERIFLSLLPEVLESEAFEEIEVVLPESNIKLANEFARFRSPKLLITCSPYQKRRGEPYLAPFRMRYARHIREIVTRFRPDRVLLLQGRIENLATPLLNLRKQAVISYIPMAHSMAEMQRKVPGGDLIRRAYYRRPDRFIVPSLAAEAQLDRAGARGEIRIVRNVVSPPPRANSIEARRLLGLPAEALTLLYMGRFDRDQKGIDRLLDSLRRSQKRLAGASLVFVGNGPAEDDIRSALKDMEAISGHSLPWTDSPHLVLSAADVLLAPSRYEGVPLVMLEAMMYEIPIIASLIDVYLEHLPTSHLFDFDTGDLASAIERVKNEGVHSAYTKHCRRTISGGDLAQSRRDFVAALVDPILS
jgi:glycosyltransferase involved in cell wall biosynthesis